MAKNKFDITMDIAAPGIPIKGINNQLLITLTNRAISIETSNEVELVSDIITTIMCKL